MTTPGNPEPPPGHERIPALQPLAAAKSTAAKPSTAKAGKAGKPKKRRRQHFARTQRAAHWVYRQLDRIPHPPPDTLRGMLLLVFVIGMGGVLLTLGGSKIVHYSESTEFCAGTCHTMEPQKKAHEAGSHRDVECSTCHVGPGILGFVKAKMGGTKELFDLATNRYPKPIHMEPTGLSALPPVEDTCLTCHAKDQLVKNDGPMQLIIGATYEPDATNTKQMFSLALKTTKEARVQDATTSEIGGVHWHIDKDIQFIASELDPERIDLIKETKADGTVTEFISSTTTGDPTLVTPDVNRIEATGDWYKMDCVSCHNRIGHDVPVAKAKVTQSIDDGNISTNIPNIKKQGDELLATEFTSYDAADAQFDLVQNRYLTEYPLLAKDGAASIGLAIDTLKADYREVATPDMLVYSGTYPNNIGHQNTPGCFRCHDGAHFEVQNGQATKKKIPNDCSTCHTFPQVGTTISEMPLGKEPIDHVNPQWVFDHSKVAPSTNPSGTSCASCHTRNYCQNCHNTGAVSINHQEMLYDHAASIKKSGLTSCRICHSSSFCNTCHTPSQNVLDTG